MPTNHEAQERYSDLTLAKIRSELVLSNGLVFNNDYEGSPTAGSVKIPVRDEEVAVSDYDKANGIQVTHGSTTYTTLVIDKDKAINELIDGYDAASVPDNLVADRIDSGGYSMARQLDMDGGTVLLAGSTPMNVSQLTTANIYATIVEVRTAMSKANIPNDGKRYLLVTPDTFALVLTCPEFIAASELGDDVKRTGAVGMIAGFLVKEWNYTTANLAMLAGHPRYATRAMEWAVGVKVQDLSGSGNYIGACAVQGRNVYGHKVLRSIAIRAVYSPGSLTVILAPGTASGKTAVTITGTDSGTTFAYKISPPTRAVYNMTSEKYGGQALTSGSDVAVKEGNVLEIVELKDSKVISVGYFTVNANDIKK